MSIAPLKLYPPHPATARGLSVSVSYDKSNNRLAYAMGRSVFIKPVDPESAVEAFQLVKHNSITTAVAFSPSGFYLATGDESGQVKIWNTPVLKSSEDSQPTVKSEFQILSGPIKAIAWDADNSRVIGVGEGKDKFGHCFTFDTGNSIGEIQGHSDVVNTVDIKPVRPYRAATAGNDKALVFYTGPPFKFDKTIRDYHSNIIRQVKFSPDGKYLISVGSDRLIVVYDGKTGEFINKIENAHDGGIFGVTWYADSSKFATCSADNSVKVWSAESFEELKTLKVDSKVTVNNQLVGLVATEKYIIAVNLKGSFVYFSTEDDSVKVYSGHQSAITASTIVEDYLITGGSDSLIFKWKIADNKLVPVPELIGDDSTKHSNYVADLLYFNKTLLSIGWDDKLKCWDLESGNLISEVQLKAQPKKLIKNGDKVNVVFESSLESYTVGNAITLGEETALKFDTNDIDIISEKLLLTNLKENKIEETSAGLKFDPIRGSPSLIKVSPDEKYIALGDTTGKYVVYNSDSTVKTTRWVFHTSKIVDAKWSPDSKFLLSGGLDCGIFIYSIDKLSKVTKFPLAHQTGISKVEWIDYDYSNASATIATTGFDGSIKLWTVDLSVYK